MGVMPPTPESMKRTLDRLVGCGFDLHAYFSVLEYNRVVDPRFALPVGEAPNPIGVLIGNTRAIWPHFIAYLRANPDVIEHDNPLEQYTEKSVYEVLESAPVSVAVRFSHQMAPAPVAMQELAQLAGLGSLSASHLNVHPVYGPWISMRAVVVFDAFSGAVFKEPAAACTPACEDRCRELFESTMGAMKSRTHLEIRAHWRDWVAVRDSCSTGRTYRYGEDQLAYHYTHDKAILRRAIAKG